ncbi:LytTR family DNA-binding domain-containing protein [Eggerthella lenta]|uniref:LytTR family DNA-binding domain-containing protein n=1 Tax=Eggerthella lenta TaxID=84112 RepID=UPI001E42BCDE|nr:LytTR family DNA-binding domain-containing protein [Eggerthella lenta]
MGPYAGRTSHRASARVERHRCEPALAFARSWPERHRIPVRALRCPGIRRRQAQLPRHGRRRSRSASQRTVRYRIRRSRCVIRHAHGKFAVRGALASLEKELPAKDFLRLHRSCLVHRGRIASIEDHQALLDDGSSYPIAERRSREIKQSFELTL